MELSSINPNNPYQYFNFDSSNPDAIVILNRGTEFEKDITNDVRTITTSNSVDSIAGSFSITLDNTNDAYVDRFGYTSVKVMSAIEIFARSLSASTTANNLGNAVDSTQIPASILNLNQFVNTYFNNPSSAQASSYQQQIIALNVSRQSPLQTYTINTANNSENDIKNIVDTGDTIQITFNDNPAPLEITYRLMISKSYPNLVFTIYDDGINSVTKPYGNHNIENIVTASSTAQPDPITKDDFLLTDNGAGKARMDNLRQSPIRIPQQTNLYPRIFFGIILNVNQNINPGAELTLNLSGKSIGYWLEATPVNVFPGGFESTFSNIDQTVYSNRYATTKAMDIFRDLIRFSTDDLIDVTDFNKDNTQTNQDVIELNGTINKPILDIYGNPIKTQNADGSTTNLTAKYVNTTPSAQYNELNNSLEKAYEGIPFNNGTSKVTSDAITNNKAWTNSGANYKKAKDKLAAAQASKDAQQATFDRQIADSTGQTQVNLKARQKKALEAADTNISNLQSQLDVAQAAVEHVPEFQIQKKTISQNQDRLQQDIARLMKAGRSNILNQFGIINHWKNIFASMILEVVDDNNFLGLIYPLKIALQDPSASMDGDYISKADLANMIAQNLMYEFYVDTNGHFILKPPLYNIGIQVDDLNYIIEETDLITLTINESVEGIITRIGVTGDWNAPVTMEKIITYNIHQDLNLIRDYGFHSQEIANLLFLKSTSDCRDFGKSYMTKNNMELNSASVTINGRPEIRLGTSIYLKPRDTMYYVKEINHEITAGGQYQTTLSLVGARRIVTGFSAQSNLTTINQQSNVAITSSNSGLSIDTAPTFHYILATATNQDAITDANTKPDNRPFNREQGLSSAQSQAIADNSNTDILLGQSVSPNDLVNQKAIQNGYVPQILRNVYQITSHINPAYVGLIVDKNNKAISDINIANYNFFISLTPTSIPNGVGKLNVPNDVKKPAFDMIHKGFIDFVSNDDTYCFNMPEKFTLNLKDQFILSFLKSTSDQVNTVTSTAGNGATTVSRSGQVVAAACTIFNQIIAAIDNGGVYRQFTDNDGRELPSYFDYGKSLLIENSDLSVAQFTDMAAATVKQKTDAAAKEKATIAKQNQPQSKQAAILNNALSSQLAAIKAANATVPKIIIPGPTK